MALKRASLAHLHPGENAEAVPSGRKIGEVDRRQLDRDRQASVVLLHDRENRLRFAAQAAGFGIFDLDCQSGDVHFSPELKAMAGLSPDQPPLPEDRLGDLLHPDDRRQFLEKFEASRQTQGNGEFEDECRLVRPDGSQLWVRIKGRVFFTGDGSERHSLGACGVVIDITAARAAEQDLLDSRAQLAGLVETMLDAVISVDSEQRVVLFNAAAAEMFRCSAAEALGSPLDRFIPARFRAAHRDHVRRFAENGTSARSMGHPGAFRGVRADGEEFPIEASIAKVMVGGHWWLTVVVRDVTERVRAEQALRDGAELLRVANEAGHIGTYDADLVNKQIRFSPDLCAILGLPPGSEMCAEAASRLVHADDLAGVLAAVQRAQAGEGEGLIRSEHRILRPDGEVRWLAWSGRVFFEETPEGPRPVREIGACVDITEHKRNEAALRQEAAERKRLEEELRRTNEALERRIAERTAELARSNEALVRSNLDLQQFAYIAAHDLQTPLRSITGFAQLLQQECRGRWGEQADLWIGQLVEYTKRMHSLIQDLLEYSRVDSRGRAFLPVDLNQIFGEVQASLEPVIRENGATLTHDELPVVLGDRVQLGQVLQNLIENGVKYRGSEPPRVHVAAEGRGREWLFSVSDNGIGIARQHRERIFEIFRRLHTQQEYPGTGIGLAVCRRVIHRHGGRIWVESEPGVGSVFYFTLPDRKLAAT